MATWLAENGLDDIRSQERYWALQVADHLDAISAWRETLTEETRRTLNDPSVCWHKWRRAAKTAPIRHEAAKLAKGYRRTTSNPPGDIIRRVAGALRMANTRDYFIMATAALNALEPNRPISSRCSRQNPHRSGQRRGRRGAPSLNPPP